MAERKLYTDGYDAFACVDPRGPRRSRGAIPVASPAASPASASRMSAASANTMLEADFARLLSLTGRTPSPERFDPASTSTSAISNPLAHGQGQRGRSPKRAAAGPPPPPASRSKGQNPQQQQQHHHHQNQPPPANRRRGRSPGRATSSPAKAPSTRPPAHTGGSPAKAPSTRPPSHGGSGSPRLLSAATGRSPAKKPPPASAKPPRKNRSPLKAPTPTRAKSPAAMARAARAKSPKPSPTIASKPVRRHSGGGGGGGSRGTSKKASPASARGVGDKSSAGSSDRRLRRSLEVKPSWLDSAQRLLGAWEVEDDEEEIRLSAGGGSSGSLFVSGSGSPVLFDQTSPFHQTNRFFDDLLLRQRSTDAADGSASGAKDGAAASPRRWSTGEAAVGPGGLPPPSRPAQSQVPPPPPASPALSPTAPVWTPSLPSAPATAPASASAPASSPAPAVPSAATAAAALDSITEPEPAPPPTRPLLATDTFSPLESNATTAAATPAPGAAVPATTTAPADAADVPGEGDAFGAAAKGAGATDDKSQQAVRPPLRRKNTFTGPQEEAKLEARALIRQSVDLDKDLVDLSNLWFASAFMLKKSPTRRTIHEFKGAVDLSISFLDSLAPLATRCGLADAGAMMREIMPQQDALSARQGRQGKGEEAQKHHEKLKANLAALGLESEEVSDILTSATLLRGLIRMKIADKNDIGTARFALAEMLHFFTTLRARAEAQNVEEWDVFCQLQH